MGIAALAGNSHAVSLRNGWQKCDFNSFFRGEFMEDFSSKGSSSEAEVSAFQLEWLASQTPETDFELAALTKLTKFSGSERNLSKQNDGPGKDVADRLDKELKQFADSKIDNPTTEMTEFQKLIDKFCQETDKKQGLKDLSEPYMKLKVKLGNKISDTYKEKEEEAQKQPGRKELEAEFSKKADSFFNKLEKLPFKEEWEIYELMEWREGESRQERNDRVRDGLKDRKDLLDSFNSVQEAVDKIEANKSAKELRLEAEHKTQLRDYRQMQKVVEKAYIRSEINH